MWLLMKKMWVKCQKENKMELLDFYNPKDQKEAEELASLILAECNGKTFEEVIERLSIPFTPKQILSKIEAEYCALDDIPFDTVVKYFNAEPNNSV